MTEEGCCNLISPNNSVFLKKFVCKIIFSKQKYTIYSIFVIIYLLHYVYSSLSNRSNSYGIAKCIVQKTASNFGEAQRPSQSPGLNIRRYRRYTQKYKRFHYGQITLIIS